MYIHIYIERAPVTEEVGVSYMCNKEIMTHRSADHLPSYNTYHIATLSKSYHSYVLLLSCLYKIDIILLLYHQSFNATKGERQPSKQLSPGATTPS